MDIWEQFLIFSAGLPRAVTIMIWALLGAILGSFIGTVVVRWPLGKSVIAGRSSCDGCARSLGLHQLIPILYFLIARGRCAVCAKAIAPVHFIAEVMAAGIGATSIALLPAAEAIWAAVLGWLLLPLMLLDWKYLWLPNRLVLLVVLAGAIRLFLMDDLDMLLMHAAFAGSAYLALEALRLFYRKFRRLDAMGSGDPKLFGATMLWVSPVYLPVHLLLSSAGGLMIAVFWRLCGKEISGMKIPFGTCIAGSAWLLFLLGFSR